MSKSDALEDRAQELAESWLNGNRTHVLTEIMERTRGPRRVALAVRVTELLIPKDRTFVTRLLSWALEP